MFCNNRLFLYITTLPTHFVRHLPLHREGELTPRPLSAYKALAETHSPNFQLSIVNFQFISPTEGLVRILTTNPSGALRAPPSLAQGRQLSPRPWVVNTGRRAHLRNTPQRLFCSLWKFRSLIFNSNYRNCYQRTKLRPKNRSLIFNFQFSIFNSFRSACRHKNSKKPPGIWKIPNAGRQLFC